MARRSQFHLRSGASRRKTDWDDGPGNNDGTILGFTTSSSAVLGLGRTPASQEGTIVRLRGFFGSYLTSATAVGDGFFGALGIGITTVQAFTDVGITALPIPLDDASWDGWMYHHYFQVTAGASGAIDDASAQARFVVDSKAMRKLEVNMVIFAVAQVVENTSAALEIQFGSRMLVKIA